jgi:small subunit ribosomal protein S15
MITTQRKHELIADYRTNDQDSGSSAVQIALLTERINAINAHFATHRHDYAARRGLMKLVGQRRKFLRYLERTNKTAYQNLIERLQLRA